MPSFSSATAAFVCAMIFAVAALTNSGVLRGANAPQPTPAPAPAQAAQPASAALPAAAAPIAAPMTAAQLISVLDQTVDWYRTLSIQQQTSTEPSDLLILYDIRQTASQAVRLAFDIARANADILGNQPAPAAAGNAATAAAPSQTIRQHQQTLDAQQQAAQAQLQSAQAALAGAAQNKHADLQAKISDLRGELDLIGARKNLLNTMAEFANGTDGSSSSALRAQIDAMAAGLPSAGIPAGPSAARAQGTAASATTTPAAPAAASAPAPAAAAAHADSGLSGKFGLWDLGENVLRLSEKIDTIKAIEKRTEALQAAFAQIRTPLVNQLKALAANGDALSAAADAANGAALGDVRGQFDSLANQFSAAAALLVPLSKEDLLFNQFRHSLGTWRDAVESQCRDAIKTLGIRLGILLVVLAIVFVGAELWKRAVLRYIQELRRQQLLLLLRRIALWVLVAVIVGFAFASELGSIVTFAGLITAGIAVAMQSVLVSIVGYFFLAGKYGIRVGDRVQIGDVTGEVIDLGLVRMYLMELGGHGMMGPTGRVVAFANSIVFQVNTGLFKQIQGYGIAWHEITLSLPAGSDFAATKNKLLAAATHALKDFHEEIERQTKEIQKTTSSRASGDAQPKVQLNFSATGVQAIVRYPVHLQHAAEIDERVSRELSSAIPSAAN
jgi:small-conductance mechanosensitive channel